MQNLNGKRIVITGGSQGLGLAMVKALAACSANVTAIGALRLSAYPEVFCVKVQLEDVVVGKELMPDGSAEHAVRSMGDLLSVTCSTG